MFSGTLVHLNVFCLSLTRASFDVWFVQTEILTELFLPVSGVRFSFATSFQYLSFVRFRSYSKPKVSHKCSLQWCKPFVDIFFHL